MSHYMRFRFLIVGSCAAQLVTSQSAGAQAVVKDPTLATLIGFLIPGGGQFYAGRSAKGAAVLGTSLAGMLLTTSALSSTCVRDGHADCSSMGLAYAGLGVSTVSWLVGFTTAGADARSYNVAKGFVPDRPCGERDEADLSGEDMLVTVHTRRQILAPASVTSASTSEEGYR